MIRGPPELVGHHGYSPGGIVVFSQSGQLMHTTAIPEDVSVTSPAVLEVWRLTPLEAPLPAPIFTVGATPGSAQRPRSAAVAAEPTQPDFAELTPELTEVRHQEYLARRALDELLERGALSALFG
jgi:hypothetical protein